MTLLILHFEFCGTKNFSDIRSFELQQQDLTFRAYPYGIFQLFRLRPQLVEFIHDDA